MDKLSTERRSANMRAIRLKDTKPELEVRRLLHSAGYRYRLHVKELPGKPDIVFSKKRKVIFVHGCFWHQHPNEACKDARLPKSNPAYWNSKLALNLRRDFEHVKDLTAAGWKAFIVWECETKKSQELDSKLRQFLDDTPPCFRKLTEN